LKGNLVLKNVEVILETLRDQEAPPHPLKVHETRPEVRQVREAAHRETLLDHEARQSSEDDSGEDRLFKETEIIKCQTYILL
jgi:hypothetical protein